MQGLTLQKISRKFLEWAKPDNPAASTMTVATARHLTNRDSFSGLLNYRVFDSNNNMVYVDDADGLSVGFVLLFNPLLGAGLDAEAQLEAVINACPPDSVLQYGVLSTPQIEGFLNTWRDARLAQCKNPIIAQIAERRRDFMLYTAQGPSMLPKTKMHPRILQYYLSLRIPFKGDLGDDGEMRAFVKNAEDIRNAIIGALQGTFIGARPVDEHDFKVLLREMLNPQMEPLERITDIHPDAALSHDIINKQTRIGITPSGNIGFSSGDAQEEGDSPAEWEVVMTPLTVDAYPKSVWLPLTANVLGSPTSWDDRITCPFWAYTTIHIMDPDKARDALTTKMGLLSKQTMTESAWYRSMMGHLFERKAATELLLSETREGHRLVRAYTGINLYNHPDEVKLSTETVKGLWRRAGFRLTEEKYIGLPVFIASLPLQYSPGMDEPGKGLQRAIIMHSLNAASLSFIQGDWAGTSPSAAGPLFVSRRGQLACFDLLQTTINFNFVIVAASGSGKSFLANEICVDFLSKNGIVRIIDVGRSYARFCEVMGGANLVFSPANPISMNPFWGLDDINQLNEMMPMLKAMMRQMAFPLLPEADTDPWQYAAIEDAIVGAWHEHRGQTDLRKVYDWLMAHPSEKANDLAYCLKPYAVGRYSPWFVGERQIAFQNDLVVIELEELKQDTELQSVVMTLIIHQVTKEMYLSGKERPKLLAIDEAWDLMGGLKTGKFIETAFRRARKYNGIAGVITQSFEDFERSDAAKAAIENAAWQFILYQRPESLEFAMKHGRISGGEGLLEILKSVRSGPGFSEVYVKGESGAGLYRFITDRHSYYTFTTKATEVSALDSMVAGGKTMEEAIDIMATADYERMWG